MQIVDERSYKRDMPNWTRSEGIAAVGLAHFVRRVVTTTKPRLVVENRSGTGFTFPLVQGLNDNGFGRLIVFDRDTENCAQIEKEITNAGFSHSASLEIRNESALQSRIEGPIDLLLCSTDHEQVVRHLLAQINPVGLILLHAGENEYQQVREIALRLDKEGVISTVVLPEGRRLVMAQKRSGRR